MAFVSWQKGGFAFIENRVNRQKGNLILRDLENQYEGSCLYWRDLDAKKASTTKYFTPTQWICRSKADIFLLTMKHKGEIASTELIYTLPKGRILDWAMPSLNAFQYSANRNMDEPHRNTVQFVTCCRDVYTLDLERHSIEAKIKIDSVKPKEKISRIVSVPTANADTTATIVYAFGEAHVYRVDLDSRKQSSAQLPADCAKASPIILKQEFDKLAFACSKSPHKYALYTFSDSRTNQVDTSRFDGAYFSEGSISGHLASFIQFFHDNPEAKPVPNAVYSNVVRNPNNVEESFILVATRNSEHEIGISSISHTGHTTLVYKGKYMIEERGPVRAIRATLNAKRQFTLLLIGSDDSLTLIRNNKRLWTREDGLAQLVQTTFFSLPSRAVVEHAGVFAELMNQLKELGDTLITSFNSLTSVVRGPSSVNMPLQSENVELFNDNHGFNRLIVGLTASNKVVAFHTQNGALVWSFHYPTISKKTVLHNDKTLTIYPCDHSFFYLVSTRDSLVTRVEVLSGKIVSQQKFSSHFDRVIAHTPQPAQTDENPTTILLLLSTENQVHIYPNSKASQLALERDGKDIFFFRADRTTGQLTGYMLLSAQDGVRAQQSWTQSLRAPIAAMTSVASSPVYSTVYQTGSGELLYKYLSRNLIAVATLTENKSSKVSSFTPHTLDLYIISSVTGSILFHTTQEFVSGPIRLIFEHNVLLCQFLNEKSRKYELSVFELFSAENSHTDRSFVEAVFGQDHHRNEVMSSFELGIPNIVRQSFVLPTGAVETLGVTHTGRGLTQKHFLFGMSNGRVLQFDKKVLDPRRPQGVPTKQSAAEGLMPYNPFLTVSPAHQYLLHNYTVANIREIISHPSDMESTTHILVRGTDLYYTRHAPSGAFDMLGADFSHILLFITIVGLFLISQTAKYFAKRQTLRREWE